ncbi:MULTISPECIES: CsgG/HfaB family protein [Thermoleptolyngbya]|nr:CsgG/HfaB family protein [Thermoleptolyngbya sp. PKUAC-SCTB121]
MGSVTEFNISTERSGGGFLGIGVGQRETTANVALTARMISTADGAIVDTMRGRGSAGDRSSSVSIVGIGGGSDRNREDELMSRAVEQAIASLVEDMNR